MTGPTSRRTALGAILAASLASVPAMIALPAQASERERSFLALIPTVLPIARRMCVARDEAHRLYVAADAAAGEDPGWEVKIAHRAWYERGTANRQTNGYHEAWEAWSACEVALLPLVEGYEDVPMRTLPAIALKSLLNPMVSGGTQVPPQTCVGRR